MENKNKSLEASTMFFGNAVSFQLMVDILEGNIYMISENLTKTEEDISIYDQFKKRELYPTSYEEGCDFLYQSSILSASILLETRIKEFCETLKKVANLKLSFTELRGTYLDSFKTYTNKLGGLDIDFSSDTWKNIKGLYELRNCIIHNFSNIESFHKKKHLIEFVKKNQFKYSMNSEWIRLVESDVLKVVMILRKFNDMICDSALNRFPK